MRLALEDRASCRARLIQRSSCVAQLAFIGYLRIPLGKVFRVARHPLRPGQASSKLMVVQRNRTTRFLREKRGNEEITLTLARGLSMTAGVGDHATSCGFSESGVGGTRRKGAPSQGESCLSHLLLFFSPKTLRSLYACACSPSRSAETLTETPRKLSDNQLLSLGYVSR